MKKIGTLLWACYALLQITSCGKKPPDSFYYCWYVVSPDGYIEGNQICGKSEQAMDEIFTPNGFFFVRDNETRFCCRFVKGQDTLYRREVTQTIVNKIFTPKGYTAQLVECNSFCKWRVTIWPKSNSTGMYGPMRARYDAFGGAQADTCSKIRRVDFIPEKTIGDTTYYLRYEGEYD